MALVLAASSFALWLGRFGSTPPFADQSGLTIPGSIAEMEQMQLGGIAQSVVFRGRNKHAPVLIWLHGGPGMDAIGMTRLYNAELEDHFVVVYWTQRGIGGPSIRRSRATP